MNFFKPGPVYGQNYLDKTANFTPTVGDVINCTSGTFAITLPTAVGVAGQSIEVVNSGSGVITINTTSSQTIFQGSALASGVIKMGTAGDTILVVSNGTNWICKHFDVNVRAHYTAASACTGTLNGSFNVTTYGTAVSDIYSMYSAGTATIPIPGTYQITASNHQNATYALGNTVNVAIFTNGANGVAGVVTTALSSVEAHPIVSTSLRLAAGALITVQSANAGTTPTFGASGSANNYFMITRTGN